MPSAFVPDEPTGTPEFVTNSRSHRQRVLDAIPPNLRLPSTIIDNLPLDVTEIPRSCGLLTTGEIAITDMDATAVRDAVAARSVTAVQAVTAFAKRAAIAHQLVNCLTDFFLDAAIEQAKKLDEHMEKTGKPVGPLHGVPISIKCHMPIAGTWSTRSFMCDASVSEQDSAAVAILRSLGAVFYCKTNCPQSGLALETNGFHGRTLNPYNRSLSPGGSSGGESALIALKGSCLGVGSDVGGSIRVPAAHCGLYGMRGTSGIIPMDHDQWYNTGGGAGTASFGPLASSLRDIDLFNRSILEADWSFTGYPQPHIPWTPALKSASGEGRKLRVGVMRHDGVIVPQPPILRGLDTVVQKLEASGQVELVPFAPLKQRKILDTYWGLFLEDGGKSVRQFCKASGEDVNVLIEWALSSPFMKHLTIEELWAIRHELQELQSEYTKHWRTSGIDVLLCPTFPSTAPPHDTSKYWGYSAVYNALDYPGIVFPTDMSADAAVDKKVPRSDFIPDREDSDKFFHDLYDPEKYQGGPISLQLLAPTYQDGQLFAAARLLDDIIRA